MLTIVVMIVSLWLRKLETVIKDCCIPQLHCLLLEMGIDNLINKHVHFILEVFENALLSQ